MGVVLLRPVLIMPMFRRGGYRLSLHRKNTATTQPAPSPPATQPLAEDPVLKPVFENKDVILRAGGISSRRPSARRLNASIRTARGSENFTLFRHEAAASAFAGPAITSLRDQYTETLAGIARENTVSG